MPELVGSDVTTLRRVNRTGALARLRATPDAYITASTVAADLGLSRPTAARLLTELAESGWAELELARTGSAGRPARTFRLRRNHGVVAALDLGVNNLLVVLADLAGTVLHRSYTPHGHPAHPADMARLATDTLTTLLGELDEKSAAPLLAVSASVPATVGRGGGLRPWVDSPDWAAPELSAVLERAFADAALPVPSLAGSPVAALRAELAAGSLREHSDGVFVLAGDVTGVAPLVDGTPYLGAHGGAGTISGLPGVDWRGATAAILDQTGAATLDDLVARGLAESGATESSRSLEDALPDAAGPALARYARLLAPGLQVLARAFDPGVLVLGGCLAPAGDMVLTPLQEAMDTALQEQSPRLLCARVDHVDAPALGGIAAALDAVDWGA